MKAVTEIKEKYFNPEQIQALTDSYRDIVFPLVTRSPDFNISYLEGGSDPERIAHYNQVFDNLSKNVAFNYKQFIERLDDPMIFYMNEPQFLANSTIQFSWEKSVSLHAQTISYDLEISTTKEFKPNTIIESIKNISSTRYTLTWSRPKGTYFFRVISRDTANPEKHWQNAANEELLFDNYADLYGVKKLIVTEDGAAATGGGGGTGTEIENEAPTSTSSSGGGSIHIAFLLSLVIFLFFRRKIRSRKLTATSA